MMVSPRPKTASASGCHNSITVFRFQKALENKSTVHDKEGILSTTSSFWIVPSRLFSPLVFMAESVVLLASGSAAMSFPTILKFRKHAT